LDSIMELAISTHWNAHQHGCGEAMVDEILELGLSRMELGYDLTRDLVPGVTEAIKNERITVTSVHNYCPIPMGAPQGHPELFLFSSSDARTRERAITHTLETARFAAAMGAKTVVVHAGRIEMKPITPKLIALAENGKQDSRRYEKLKMKLLTKRDAKAARHKEYLYDCLEKMLPDLESRQVSLALEKQPSREAMPTETEMLDIAQHFESPFIRHWYDAGHGKIRDNLGMVASIRWLQRLEPWLAGMHLHDVQFPARDHIMPPQGGMDFELLRPFFRDNLPLVLEPAPGTPRDYIMEAIRLLQAPQDTGVTHVEEGQA
jgi:sugar phosphate isomerase/epimerase